MDNKAGASIWELEGAVREETFGEPDARERAIAAMDIAPVEDDPGRTMVSAKLLSLDTVELTSKRNGEVVAIRRMSAGLGGQAIHVVFKNKEGKTMMTFDMQKEP